MGVQSFLRQNLSLRTLVKEKPPVLAPAGAPDVMKTDIGFPTTARALPATVQQTTFTTKEAALTFSGGTGGITLVWLLARALVPFLATVWFPVVLCVIFAVLLIRLDLKDPDSIKGMTQFQIERHRTTILVAGFFNAATLISAVTGLSAGVQAAIGG